LLTISHLAIWYLNFLSAPCHRKLALILSICLCVPSVNQ
jgi:hypothetical protein